MNISRRLFLEYFALLRRHNATNAILRVPPDDALQIEEQIREQLASAGETSQGETTDNRTLNGNGFQTILDMVRKEVELGTARAGFTVPVPLLVALFPTGSLDAQALPRTGGVLVLINSGAITLMVETLKVNVWSAQVDGLPALLNREETVMSLADMVHTYLQDEQVGPMEPIFHTLAQGDLFQAFVFYNDTNDRRQYYLNRLIRPCLRFMVAHEYGHVIAGHTERPLAVGKDTPVGYIPVVRKSMEQEYQADLLGAKILLAHFEPPTEDTTDLFQYAPVVAPLYFFSLHGFIDRVKAKVGQTSVVISHDHPPSSERWLRLYDFLDNEFDGAGWPRKALDLPVALEHWLNLLEDDVVAAVQQLR